jgi:biotin synthase
MHLNPQLSRDEVRRLLTSTGDSQQELFARARATRRAVCGDQVWLRGLVEISSYCQKKCDYCAMRAPNRKLDRYRLTADEILDVVAVIHSHGLPIAFLQGGQDPRCDEVVEEVIPVIKREFGMHVLLCLGERPRHVYERWVELGADSYILKVEASDPQLYRDVIHAPIERRLECTRWIQELGMKLGTGNIVGLPGQTLEHLVDDVFFAASLRPDFVSSAPFIPNEDTPYENGGYGSVDVTLNTMALWRVLLRSPLIPTVSPLEKIRPGGQLAGLNAGANVMTINFTPTEWRQRYAIYSRERFVVSIDHAFRTIERAGLRPYGRAASPAPAGAEEEPATPEEPEPRRLTLPLRPVAAEHGCGTPACDHGGES